MLSVFDLRDALLALPTFLYEKLFFGPIPEVIHLTVWLAGLLPKLISPSAYFFLVRTGHLKHPKYRTVRQSPAVGYSYPHGILAPHRQPIFTACKVRMVLANPPDAEADWAVFIHLGQRKLNNFSSSLTADCALPSAGPLPLRLL